MPKLAQVDLLNPVGRPWDRQPNEPGNWFMRFDAYRALGTIRTVDAAYEAEKSKAIQAGKYTIQSVPILSQWKAKARAWAWADRAALWDAEQVVLVRAQDEARQQVIAADAETDRVIQRQRRHKILDAIYNPIIKHLEANPINFSAFKPSEQIALIKLLLQENRTEFEELPGKDLLLKIVGKSDDELIKIISGETRVTG